MSKAIGWIVNIILFILIISFFTLSYLPMRKELTDVKGELQMWEEIVKRKGEHLKSWHFKPEEFFSGDRVSPRGEVMLARVFDSLAVYPKEKTLSLTATGSKEDLLLWSYRLDNTLKFLIKNCSLKMASYSLSFRSDNLERFSVNVDD